MPLKNGESKLHNTRPGFARQVMLFQLWFIMVALSLTPASCSNRSLQTNEAQAVDAAWKALKPYSNSEDFSNWESVNSKLVRGDEAANLFEGETAPGCWKGPISLQNKLINPSRTYWLVQMKPKPATPIALDRTPSPTEPPFIPEPFLRDAFFLIDTKTGEILARKLYCVIY